MPGLSFQQLQAMGAQPAATPTATAPAPSNAGGGLSFQQLQQMGAKPTTAATTAPAPTRASEIGTGVLAGLKQAGNMFANIPESFAAPFLKVAGSGVRALQATPQLFSGDVQGAKQTMATPILGQKTLQGSTPLQNVGTAAQVASNLVGIKGELPSIIGGQTTKAALGGTVQGAVSGGGSYLADTQKPTLGGALGATGQGALQGLATGYTAAKANPLFTSDINNPASLTYKATHPSAALPDVLTKDVPTLRAGAIMKGLQEQNARLKSVGNSFNENTRTVTQPDGTKATVTPADTFAKYGIKPEVNKGTIIMGDYQQGTGELGKIKTQVSNIDSQIDTTLKNTGTKIDVQQLKNEAIAAAKANPQLKRAGTVASTVAKLTSRFADYEASYGTKLDIQELNNIRKVANQDYSPDTQDASKIVGDVARDKVYNSTPDQKVKSLLQEQGHLLSARDYAQKLNGTKVQGGRLGQYAMRTAGAVVGSTVDKLPVAGPILGALGGDYLARGLQSAQFTSPLAELKAGLQKVGSQPVGLSIKDVSEAKPYLKNGKVYIPGQKAVPINVYKQLQAGAFPKALRQGETIPRDEGFQPRPVR